MLATIFKWQNADSTLDLNRRFSAFLRRGILGGGVIVPVPSTLAVRISPWVAVSYDGMLVTEDTNSPVLNIPVNQTSIISAKAQYRLADTPILEYVVTEASAFNALPDKDYHVVFGAITLSGAATEITVANISLFQRTILDSIGRSPFRGKISTIAELPPNSPVGGNLPGDFFVINQGVGDLPALYCWDGTAWQNITNTLSIAADLTAHRLNLFANEKHLTDDQKDAAAGSQGTPSALNRYVTELDTRLPTQNENDALQGSNGSPSDTNRYLSQEYPLAVTTLVNYVFPLSPITLVAANGPFYVGKNGVGSANGFFSLLDFNLNQGYLNNLDVAPVITGLFTDPLLTIALDPSVNPAVDADGFFTGDLYIAVSASVNTAFRIAYGKRTQAKAMPRSLTVGSNPGDEYIPSQVLEKVLNIKGRSFYSAVPTREQNINLRQDLDYTTSYLGSVLETNVVANNEDYARLSNEPVIGSNFVKNLGILPVYTFQNTSLIGFSYNSSNGRVTYNSGVGLSSVAVGNLFVDGLGREFRVTAVNDGLDYVEIANTDTGIIPTSISTSVGTSSDGSIKKNNNPRNLLLSEMKYSQGVDKIGITKIFQKQDEFSKLDGRVAYGVLRYDSLLEPRLVLYGAWENFLSNFNEAYVRCAGQGSIVVTGFFTNVVLLMKRFATGPDLNISINGEAATTISTAQSGGSSVSSLGGARGPRYERLTVASGLDASVPTTVTISVDTPTASALQVYGIEMVKANSTSGSILEPGIAFENTALIKRSSLTTSLISPVTPNRARGGKSVIAVGTENYQIGTATLTDLDGNSPPSGSCTGTAITGVVSTKLSGYSAGDLIVIEGTNTVIRRISSISGTTVNLDSNTGFASAVTFIHLCSLDNSAPSSVDSQSLRYQLPASFLNNTTNDFETISSQDRFVVHPDGHTVVAGTQISVIDTGFSGASKAIKVNNGGYIKFIVTGTRFDLITNNTSSATVTVSVNGSPTYSLSISGSGATKKTIYQNGRYQSYELILTPTVGDLVISEMMVYEPAAPTISSNPNVVVELPLIANYSNSKSTYLLAPQQYPTGSVFYESFSHMTCLLGTGVNTDWAYAVDFTKAPYGSHSFTSNDGASATFRFLGSAFELSYLTGPDCGIFRVTVDGVALQSSGGTIVGTYTGNQVDAYAAVASKRNIGAYGLSFGWHEVRASIATPRTKNALSSGFRMAFAGYWVGNIGPGGLNSETGPITFGMSRNGVYSGLVDVRNFIPDIFRRDKAPKAAATLSYNRAQVVSVPNGATTVSITYSNPMPNTDYALTVNWLNTVDGSPLYQPLMISGYTTTGFTVTWNYPVDSANYRLTYYLTGFV